MDEETRARARFRAIVHAMMADQELNELLAKKNELKAKKINIASAIDARRQVVFEDAVRIFEAENS